MYQSLRHTLRHASYVNLQVHIIFMLPWYGQLTLTPLDVDKSRDIAFPGKDTKTGFAILFRRLH